MKFRDNHVCYLEITTFIGMSIGAVHFYASFYFREEKIDFNRTLDSKSAKRFNKERGERDNFYKKGSQVNAWESREEIIEEALRAYKTHFPAAKLLVEGQHSYVDPHLVLDGPAITMRKCNDIYDSCEAIGWWDDEDQREYMEELSGEWWDIINALAYPDSEVGPRVVQSPNEAPEINPFPVVENPPEQTPEERRAEREREHQKRVEWKESLETMEVTLTFRRAWSPEQKKGYIDFFWASCDVSGEDGKEVGSIKADSSASTWVFDNASGEGWTAFADDIWYSVQAALEKRRLVQA